MAVQEYLEEKYGEEVLRTTLKLLRPLIKRCRGLPRRPYKRGVQRK